MTSLICSISRCLLASKSTPSLSLVTFFGDSAILRVRFCSRLDSVTIFLFFCILNQQRMNHNLPPRTILANLTSEEAFNADHPLFYTKERTHYLDRLTQKVSIQTDLPTVDLRRNMRIDHYLGQYNQIKERQQKQARVRNTLLKTKEFNSIFKEDEERHRNEKRNIKESKSIQQTLYKNYVEEVNLYQPPQRDHQPPGQPQTVLTLDQNRMKELYLLDLEIGKLRYEEQLERTIKERGESCQNNALLGKLSSTIISSYMVYFEEIFALLIDQILEDEVIHLNHLEANYKVKQIASQPLESRQTLQMIELVKALEDLCDD